MSLPDPELAEHDLPALLDYMDGTLAPAARAELDARLGAEPALLAALQDLRQVRTALDATAREFRAGFVDRVATRIRRPRTLADGLGRQARWLLPIAALLVVALGVRNLTVGRASGAGSLDAALGLTPVTMDAALQDASMQWTTPLHSAR
jgi:anti-sigma factor RsiW